MTSTFSFFGGLIRDQIVARDQNAFLAQTGQVKTEQDLEEEKELRLENACQALLFFDQGGKPIDEDNLSELFDLDARMELQTNQLDFHGLDEDDHTGSSILTGVSSIRNLLSRLDLCVNIDSEPGSVRVEGSVVSVKWRLAPVVQGPSYPMWSVMYFEDERITAHVVCGLLPEESDRKNVQQKKVFNMKLR